MGNINGQQQQAASMGNSDEQQAMKAMPAAMAAKAIIAERTEMAGRAAT